MIVSGTSPPYQFTAQKSDVALNSDVIKLTKCRSDCLLSSRPKENPKLRPKSSTLKISEKILKDFNFDNPESQLRLSDEKFKKNLRMVEGKFSRKGLYFKNVQPGFSMTKKKDGINVTLNMDELCSSKKEQSNFSGRCESYNAVNETVDQLSTYRPLNNWALELTTQLLKMNCRSTTLKTLQQQLENLNKILEEERLTHRAQFKQFIDNTKVDVQIMLQEHRDHIRSIEDEHNEQIERLTDMYETKLTERATEAESESARLQDEIHSMKLSLETCKEDVVAELNEKWLLEKKQLECDHDLRTKQALEQQRHKLSQDKMAEVSEMKGMHEKEICELVEQHHRESEEMSAKFLEMAGDAEKLQNSLRETELYQIFHDSTSVMLKQEVIDLQTALTTLKRDLKKTKNELADAKVTLHGYELSFSEKVAEIEERHAMKIHGLMQNNTDIKRNYMRKCTELLDVQTKTDNAQKKNATDAKIRMKTIILARAKADISLVGHDEHSQVPRTARPSRPQSAPILKVHDSPTTLYRPNSSLT